jgi:chemotaxis protein MotB
VKMGDKPPEKRTINLQAAQALVEQQERTRLGELKRRLEAAIDANPTLRNFKRQLRIDLVPDGLRIQIVDEQNRPMFDTGSAVLRDYTRDILREVAQALNDVPNRISLSGHTDAARYAGGERGYSNWELSADRANASRRELIAGGIADDKIVRVMGLGAAIMQNGDDPLDPVNRRIGIVVLNHKAEERILHEGLPAAPPAAATADAPPPSGETTVPSPPSGVAATRDSVRASQ